MKMMKTMAMIRTATRYGIAFAGSTKKYQTRIPIAKIKNPARNRSSLLLLEEELTDIVIGFHVSGVLMRERQGEEYFAGDRFVFAHECLIYDHCVVVPAG